MKTLNTLILFVLVAFANTATAQQIKSHIPYLKDLKKIPTATAAESTLRAASVNPNETLYFEWNIALSQWDTVSLSYNSYNASNEIESILTLDYSYPNAKFDTAAYATYTYNSNGDITEILYKDYMNSTWVNSKKDVFVYNANNHLIESLTFYWDGTIWDLLEGDKSILTYDNNGLVIKEEMEYYEMSTTSWEKYQMNEIFYPAGIPMPDSIVMYAYENNTWVVDGKMVNITWYDFSKYLFSSYDVIMMDNGSWGDPLRIVSTYNSNDQLTGMVYKMSLMGNFVDFMRYTFTYDSYGNETETKIETFMTGTWEVFGHQINTYSYDNSGLMIESESKSYDKTSGNWYNTNKYQYRYSTTTGIVDNIEKEVIKAFPNPFKEVLNISNEGFNKEEVKLTIFDMGGRMVYEDIISSSKNASLDLKELNNGVYFLNISSNDKSKTVKIVKQ